MLSRLQTLRKSLAFCSLLLTLSACNQQEFYEKDFLEGVGIPDLPETSIPDLEIPTVTDTTNPGGGTTNPGGGTTNPGGGTTNPGGGTTNPGVCGTGSVVNASDTFTQNIAQEGKVDILWVVDNSGSMGDEQNDLAYNFDVFINEFIKRNVDFKMAITTTDGRSSHNGRMIGDSNLLTSQAAKDDQNQFMNNFKNWIRVGTNGSGNEMGLHTSESFFNRYNDFARDDAFLVIVYLSDEEDHSSKAVSEYVNYIQSLKSRKGLLQTYSIVTRELDPAKRWETVGNRYMELTNSIGGTVSDIHRDFHETLTSIGGSILDLLDRFPLSSVPVNTDIKVTINNNEAISGWTYDSASQSIIFDKNSIPNQGSIVIAFYQKCDGN